MFNLCLFDYLGILGYDIEMGWTIVREMILNWWVLVRKLLNEYVCTFLAIFMTFLGVSWIMIWKWDFDSQCENEN